MPLLSERNAEFLHNGAPGTIAPDRLVIPADTHGVAGCARVAILNHRRQQRAVHGRGCWLLDLILGKVESVTEGEWLDCPDPTPMLSFLESCYQVHLSGPSVGDQPRGAVPELLRREPAARKVWLFCCACARRGEYLGDPRVAKDRRRGIETTEEFLDGRIAYADWRNASVDYLDAHYDAASTVVGHLFYGWTSSFEAAIDAADTIAREKWTHPDEDYEEYLSRFSLEEQATKRTAENERRRILSDLLRCVVGNPFRTITLDPAWLTRTVLGLAPVAYESRSLPSGTLDNLRLAILADALEDAGCHNAALLNHCRQPEDHVRGCWVLDALLTKEQTP